MGDFGRWQKNTLFERAACIPLIIADPNLPRKQRAGGPVGLIDLYPTIAALTDLPASEYLDRKVLTAMLRDLLRSVNEAVFTQYQNGYLMVKLSKVPAYAELTGLIDFYGYWKGRCDCVQV